MASSPPLHISNRQARHLFLHCQGLSRPPQKPLRAGALAALIDDLGFVQVDSIKTVERAHHMILFARCQSYRPKQLQRLLKPQGLFFENWTHDAAIIPSRLFPYWRHRFASERQRLIELWRRSRQGSFEGELQAVLDHVSTHGPTFARELKKTPKSSKTGWWDWHPSKTALEFLWRTGDLSVAHRQGFQKCYDLSHKVIAEDHFSARVTYDEMVEWACRSALRRLGTATSGELAAFWAAISPAQSKSWVQAQPADALIPVAIEDCRGGKDRMAWAAADFEQHLSTVPEPPSRLRILSPFDPLIRDRKRLERLFNFYYRIEVFVPQAKRQYGYYVFPMLMGDRFVGRIDMKFLRETDALHVSKIWWEAGLRPSKARQQKLHAELDRVRRFIGAEKISFANDYQ